MRPTPTADYVYYPTEIRERYEMSCTTVHLARDFAFDVNRCLHETGPGASIPRIPLQEFETLITSVRLILKGLNMFYSLLLCE